MESKRFFFLAGLQRSGGTLLASILNQNPDIWVSPASPMFRLMSSQKAMYVSSENLDYSRNKSLALVMQQTPHIFYSDKSATNIIDKNLNWQTLLGLQIIMENISEAPRIICPVRSIPEILASYEALITSSESNTNNAIDAMVQQETIPYGSLADRRADWLMRHDKDIQICLNGMKLALNPQLSHMFLFVEYDNLVANPEQQIKRIYDFLEIKGFDHEYQNIVDPTGISEDSPVTGIKYLHKVRPKIEKKSRPVEEVLSPLTVRRYSGLEFWRDIQN